MTKLYTTTKYLSCKHNKNEQRHAGQFFFSKQYSHNILKYHLLSGKTFNKILQVYQSQKPQYVLNKNKERKHLYLDTPMSTHPLCIPLSLPFTIPPMCTCTALCTSPTHPARAYITTITVTATGTRRIGRIGRRRVGRRRVGRRGVGRRGVRRIGRRGGEIVVAYVITIRTSTTWVVVFGRPSRRA